MPDDATDAPASELALGPLTDDDVDVLLDAFTDVPKDQYRIVTEESEGQRIGDPGTLAVILIVSHTAIGALSAFLAKRRSSRSMTYTLEITEADGSTRREHLQIDASESEAPSPEVVAELARLTRTPLPPQLEGPTQ